MAAECIDGNDSDGWLSLTGGEYTQTKDISYGGPNDIVGDHTNGIVDVNGGEHNIITGFGYPTVLPASQYGVIRENADLTLSNIKVWEIYGIANHIQDRYPYQNNLHVQSKNVNITLANSTVTSIVSGSQAVLYGSNGSVFTENTNLTVKDSSIAEALWGQLSQTFMSSQADLISKDSTILFERSDVPELIGNYVTSWVLEENSTFVALNANIEIVDSEVDRSIAGYGFFQSSSANSLTGKFENNNQTVRGSTVVSESLYGAELELLDSTVKEVTFKSNKVTIENGTVVGDVIGSIAYLRGDTQIESIIFEDNRIVLRGSPDLSKANISGYKFNGAVNSVETSGNTLEIDGFKGNINSINNFDEIVFKNVTWETGGTVVWVLNNEATSDLGESAIVLNDSTTLSGGTQLQAGDFMYFIRTAEENDFETDPGKISSSENVFTAGVAFEGKGEVQVDPNGSVKYVITDVRTTDQSDNVAAMNTASQAFLLQANDLVVDGLNALERDQLFGTKLFAVGEGTYSKYDVADDLKINGWNGLVGTGDVSRKKDGDLSWAAFFEFGDANSRFHFDFGDSSHRTDSKFHYRGGGLAMRYRSNNGWYWDASARGGIIHTKAENAFLDGSGEFFDHHLRTDYWSAHAGIGRLFETGDTDELDVFARFFYTHFGDNSFRVASDRFELDSVQSEQLRTGLRWTFNKNETFKWYLGTALEYEFDGEATGSANGIDLRSASLDGATGYAELGMRYRKTEDSPWDFEARVRGYMGVRDGVSGVVRATYAFH